MDISRINQPMVNVANTGGNVSEKKDGATIKTDDAFMQNNQTAWKNFQLDQKIAAVRQQVTSDQKKSKIYSLFTKALVTAGVASMAGAAVALGALSAPFVGLGLMGLTFGSIMLGGKTYRISEGLEHRAMATEGKIMMYEMEKLGNSLGISDK